MSLLLAFDTATRWCSVALAENGRVIAARAEGAERLSHAEKLNVFIDEVLREAGRSMGALEAIAVGIGPGSYTGLRIGLSAAKGLCFALEVPLIGMSTLDVLVHELRASTNVLTREDVSHPMVDARRMEVFTGVARSFGAVEGSRPAILDDAWCAALATDRRHVVFGDGADKAAALWADHAHILHVPGIQPGVKGAASCAHDLFERREFADTAYLVPDYGKEANLTQPGKR